MDICSTRASPLHQVGMHGASNRDTHLCSPHNNSSVHLTTTYVRRTGPIINGMRSGWRTLQVSVLSSLTPAPTLPKWLCQEQRGSGLTASAPVSNVFTPAYTNVVWHLLRLVGMVQKNKPSTMLSSNVQSIDLPMECTAWRFWMTRNGMAAQHLPYQKHSPTLFKVIINNRSISHKDDLKCLGVLFDNKLRWKPHVQKVKTQLSRACGVHSKRKHYTTQSVSKVVYNALIYAYLNYSILS